MPRLQARLLRYSQTLEMLWGSLGVALGWLWGSLGVALGWPWGAYAVPINRPWGGLGVALDGLAQPPFWFQLSAFSISAFAQLRLWGGLPSQSRITNHESPPAWSRASAWHRPPRARGPPQNRATSRFLPVGNWRG